MENCCDEHCASYGCNQGRNCPVRKQMLIEQKEPQKDKPNHVLNLLIYAMIFCFVAIVTVFTVAR